MSNTETLTAELRTTAGTGAARALRRNGKIPSVVYGNGQKLLSVAVDAKAMNLRFRRQGFWTSLIQLQVGNDNYRIIPTDVQIHPVTDLLEHIDFMHVTNDDKLKVHVKINLVNQDKCKGIKLGGVLNFPNRAIDLVCSADSLVSAIDVDVSTLNIGDSIHLSDLNIPAGAKTVATENLTIATITGRMADAASTDDGQSEESSDS
ncbi:MAG: 50S ribosomal protein L25/general stress protein Ctc [Pseudomonadota bacterium]